MHTLKIYKVFGSGFISVPCGEKLVASTVGPVSRDGVCPMFLNHWNSLSPESISYPQRKPSSNLQFVDDSENYLPHFWIPLSKRHKPSVENMHSTFVHISKPSFTDKKHWDLISLKAMFNISSKTKCWNY